MSAAGATVVQSTLLSTPQSRAADILQSTVLEYLSVRRNCNRPPLSAARLSAGRAALQPRSLQQVGELSQAAGENHHSTGGASSEAWILAASYINICYHQ